MFIIIGTQLDSYNMLIVKRAPKELKLVNGEYIALQVNHRKRKNSHCRYKKKC